MKAIGVIEFGGPEVLRVVDVANSLPAPGQLRIRVHAATVNPVDTGLRSGGSAAMLKDVPPPYVPGMEVAGVLDRVGLDTSTKLRVGQRVMAIVVPHGSQGGYAQAVTVPAESVVPVPIGVTDAEAATLPMNGLTARLALDVLGLAPGQSVGVTGAAGAVGGYVVQLAKADGLRVIADASDADAQLVRNLGADVVVQRGSGFSERVRLAEAQGVDGLVDCALLDELAVPAVRDRGRIATVRGFTGEGDRGVTFHPVVVRNHAREQSKLDRLRQQVEAGQLALRVARVLAAEQAAEAHRILEAGGTRGGLVLKF
jgi:NADPH:quinone reductase